MDGQKNRLSKGSVVYQIFLRSFTLDGTLAAAEQLLPHIASLGVDVVYLCPVVLADGDERREFWSERQRQSGMENPKNPYRLSDYFAIDPEYGTDEDLRNFVRTAHQCKLRVLLDLVYFHCGPAARCLEEHPDFVKRDENGNPVNGRWHFPQLNFDNPELREYLWSNMEYFLREFDVDGYRCDVSGAVPLDFWEEGRRRMERWKPASLLLAESESTPVEDQKSAFDANYSFAFSFLLNDILKGEKTAEEFWTMWEEHPLYHEPGLCFLRCFDNHDIASDNYDARPERNGRNAMVDAALAVLFTMNGVPFLYNGQEVADGRRHSLFSNRFTGKNLVVDWARGLTPAGEGRMQLIRELVQLRRDSRALQSGEVVKVDNSTPKQVLSYLRRTPEESLLVAVNLSAAPAETEFSVPGVKERAALPPGGWIVQSL